MKQEKTGLIKHFVIILLILLIGFIDRIYRSLFPLQYIPILSHLLMALLFAAFLIFSYFYFHKPYVALLSKIENYYKDFVDFTAIGKDTNGNPISREEFNNLEGLIELYKSEQVQQSELVCQLTNTNKVLEQNSKFANAIVQITSEILRSGDIHGILQLILDKAIEIIPNAQKGSILLYNNNFLEFKAMYGYDLEALKDFKFSFNEIFQYNAKDIYEPIIINNVEQFNENLKKEKYDILKDTRSFEVSSSISCAISVDNQFYGTINIDNAESNYAFVEGHKPIIKYFAEQIGIALKNAQLLEKIMYMSHYDSLTNVCNRAYFEEQLNALYKDCSQNNQGFALVVLDMNDLKLANDTFGHDAGDKLITTLTGYISNIDPKPAILGRIGGDEFALVYKDKSSQEMQQIMDSVRAHFVEAPFKHNNQEILNITFGYGIATFPENGEDIATLFKNADYLMYIDKRCYKYTNM